jgi:hypothetical protein
MIYFSLSPIKPLSPPRRSGKFRPRTSRRECACKDRNGTAQAAALTIAAESLARISGDRASRSLMAQQHTYGGSACGGMLGLSDTAFAMELEGGEAGVLDWLPAHPAWDDGLHCHPSVLRHHAQPRSLGCAPGTADHVFPKDVTNILRPDGSGRLVHIWEQCFCNSLQ